MRFKKEIRLVGNEFTGYGHRKLTIEVYSPCGRGEKHKLFHATTTNMEMTDSLKDDSDYKANKAVRECIRFVCNQNDVSYSNAKLIV